MSLSYVDDFDADAWATFDVESAVAGELKRRVESMDKECEETTRGSSSAEPNDGEEPRSAHGGPTSSCAATPARHRSHLPLSCSLPA